VTDDETGESMEPTGEVGVNETQLLLKIFQFSFLKKIFLFKHNRCKQIHRQSELNLITLLLSTV